MRTLPPIWAVALAMAGGALWAHGGPFWPDPTGLLLGVLACSLVAAGLRLAARYGSVSPSGYRILLIVGGVMLLLAWAGLSALWSAGLGAARLEARPALSSKGEQVWARVRVRGLATGQAGFGGVPQQRVLVEVGPAWTADGLKWESPALFQISMPSHRPPRPGEVWLAELKLSPPLGLRNAAGFDAESYAFQANLAGQGRVVSERGRPLMFQHGRDEGFWTHVEQMRLSIRDSIHEALPSARYLGVMTGLVIGDQKGIHPDDWQLFSATGTGHLVAISGMHVTLFAVLARWVIRRLWRLGARRPLQLPLWLPAPPVVMLGAAAGAMAYALLAGFNLPAQRTAWMVLVVSVAGAVGLRAGRWGIVSLTLLLMLLWDPSAVLSPGFWLSFIAVSVLMAQPEPASPPAQRLQAARGSRARRLMRQALSQLGPAARSQLAITAGLAGLTVVFFQQFSVVGPVANALAIPVVSFLVTPLAMLGVLLAPLGLSFPLQWAHGSFGLLMDWLGWLAQPDWAVLAIPAPPPWAAGAAVAGPLLALMLPRARAWTCRGLELRHLGWLGLLGLLAGGQAGPANGRWRLEAMEVGQGSALLIRTAHHSLLLDTGPPMGQGLAIDRVVMPHLTARGVRRLDGLLISHGDADHASGVLRAIEQFKPSWAIGNLKSGQPPGLPRCQDGHQWSWDGVRFTIRQLPQPVFSKIGGNLDSCGLEVEDVDGHRLVVLGDVHAPQEQQIAERAGWRAGPGEVALVLSHHGSKTSTAPELLEALRPALAISQSAHHHRFGHPHAVVQARLQHYGVPLARTDLLGLVVVESAAEGLQQQSWLEGHRRPWTTGRGR